MIANGAGGPARAPPASMIGSTGSTHGESAVMNSGDERDPEQDEHDRRVGLTLLRRHEIRLSTSAVGSATMDQLLTVDDAERLAEQALAPERGATSPAARATSARSLESRGVLELPAAPARARRRVDGLDGDDRARHAGLDARPRRADGVSADRARGRRGRDGARRSRGGDAHVPLDGRDRDAGGGRGRGAGRRALAPDLRLPRPRGQRRADRAGARGGLLGARAHRRPARLRDPAREARTGFEAPEDDVPAIVAARERGARREGHHSLGLLDSGLDWDYVSELRERWKVPVVVKGLVDGRGRDPRLRARRGGRRRLEPRRPPARRRDRVARGAAGGRRGGRRSAEVYLDGGVRRGTDVVDGARARRAGGARRPAGAVRASRSAARKGVAQVLELLRDETEIALALLGCRSPAEVTRGARASRRSAVGIAELTRNAVDVLPEGELEAKLRSAGRCASSSASTSPRPTSTSAAASRSSACAPSRTRGTPAS